MSCKTKLNNSKKLETPPDQGKNTYNPACSKLCATMNTRFTIISKMFNPLTVFVINENESQIAKAGN